MSGATCLACARRSQLYLCPHCINTLNGYLTRLPWLLTQLDITVRGQDRLTTGSSIGKTAYASSVPIDLDGLDVKGDARKVLGNTVRRIQLTGEHIRPPRTVPLWFIGPLPPDWQRTHYTPTTMDVCGWLLAHRRRIPKSMYAGEIFRDFRDLIVGDQGDEDGALISAINRNERRYYGPCSTTTGRDRRGRPTECGTDLYGPRDADMVTCPECHVSVSTTYQLDQTKARSDLKTMDMIIDTMRTLGEPAGRNRVQKWINNGRLQRRGYYNQDRGITPKRVRRGDPAVYSLDQARALLEDDQHRKQKADA